MGSALTALLGPHAPGSTLPAYDGGSILNLPVEIGRLLGVADGWEAPPLAAEARIDAPGVRRVALLVIDGLGWSRLRRYAAEEPRWERFIARHGARAAPLTSVVPATTTVATTALLSNGASPARSGMLGYSQRLPALGRVADMLAWRALAEAAAPSAPLATLGVRPETFLPTPSLFETLEAGGIATTAFLPAAIRASPLSRMQFRGAAPRATEGLADALRQLGAVLVDHPETGFAYVYHPDLDAVSHSHGPEGEAWDATFGGILATLDAWLGALPAAARRGTLLLVTADHGLVATPLAERRLLASFEGVTALLACPAGGEARHVHLYARPGAAGALVEATRKVLGEAFTVLEGRQALDAGLYGAAGPHHAEAAQRIGDVVVLARGGASLWADDPGTVLRGMHGALDEREMRVPLVTLPLFDAR